MRGSSRRPVAGCRETLTRGTLPTGRPARGTRGPGRQDAGRQMPDAARPDRFIHLTILAGVLAGLLVCWHLRGCAQRGGARGQAPGRRPHESRQRRGTGVSAEEPGSQQDPAFVALKEAPGPIGRRADGSFGISLAPDHPEQAEPRAQDEQRHVSQAADRLDRQGLGAQGLRRRRQGSRLHRPELLGLLCPSGPLSLSAHERLRQLVSHGHGISGRDLYRVRAITGTKAMVSVDRHGQFEQWPRGPDVDGRIRQAAGELLMAASRDGQLEYAVPAFHAGRSAARRAELGGLGPDATRLLLCPGEGLDVDPGGAPDRCPERRRRRPGPGHRQRADRKWNRQPAGMAHVGRRESPYRDRRLRKSPRPTPSSRPAAWAATTPARPPGSTLYPRRRCGRCCSTATPLQASDWYPAGGIDHGSTSCFLDLMRASLPVHAWTNNVCRCPSVCYYACLPHGSLESGAGAEIRTRTPLRAAEFKSAASAIPPLRRTRRVAEPDARASDHSGALARNRRTLYSRLR